MKKDCVLLVTSNRIGKGDEKLGAILMNSYFHVLNEGEEMPSCIILMHEGVRLAVEETPVLALLRDFEAKGIQIFSCGTCLDYFNLKDKLKVGRVGNMYGTRDMLAGAGKVITLG